MRVPINRLESIWPQSSSESAAEASKHTSWGDTAKSWEHSLEDLLAEHPKLAIGAAAAFGLVLGWLVKRK
jgi:ElaB/YqjD/DUF883 family membrane-anchored ribosome-binding protein